jgi:hypothetical protein
MDKSYRQNDCDVDENTGSSDIMMSDTATAIHMVTPGVQRRESMSTEEATSMDLKRRSRHLLLAAIGLLALCALIYGEAKADGLGPAPERSFTIAVIPDTQGYRGSKTKAQAESTDPVTNPVFEAHTIWIAENIDAQRIVFVSHTGDIVDKNVPSQWAVALACMNRLHGRIPYAISVGNHDMTGSGDSSLFQGLFPASRYTDLPWYGGSFKAAPERPKASGSNANSYQLISAEGVGLVILHLECNAPADVLQWADSILKKHSDRLGIVATHMDLGPLQRPKTNKGYLDDPKGCMQWKKRHGVRGMSPQQMWDTCYRKHPNLAIVFSGDQSRTTAMYLPLAGDHGNTVHALLSDYTSSGPMRLYRFLPDEDTVQVITYNTRQKRMVKNTSYVPDPAAHQFSIKIPIGKYRKATE